MGLGASHLYLLAAVVAEVLATTALARTDGFTRLGPSLLTVAGYAVAFVLLAQALRTLPTGVAYAIWSGLGIVGITAIAWIWFGQTLDLAAVLGIGLILAGVLVVQLFSSAGPH